MERGVARPESLRGRVESRGNFERVKTGQWRVRIVAPLLDLSREATESRRPIRP